MPTRAEYARNPEHYRAYNRDYLRKYREVHSQRGDVKQKARRAVRTKLDKGEMVRGDCEVIGCHAKTEAHHDDYSKPLEVRWLCKTHHEEEHHK